MAITAWTDPYSSSLLPQQITPDGYVLTSGGLSDESTGTGASPPLTEGQLWPRGK